MHVVRSLFLYEGDNTGVVRVLCPNDGDNMHDVRALMVELTQNVPSFSYLRTITSITIFPLIISTCATSSIVWSTKGKKLG